MLQRAILGEQWEHGNDTAAFTAHMNSPVSPLPLAVSDELRGDASRVLRRGFAIGEIDARTIDKPAVAVP
jgi:hypothetical protein